jgi:hypothetical protein
MTVPGTPDSAVLHGDHGEVRNWRHGQTEGTDSNAAGS